jgi:DNA mismatch repair ATPase MutS
VNLALAYAGAPVNAERMRTSWFRLFTCVKVSDSVQDGLSYFYAEVKRLQALLAARSWTTRCP